MAPRRQPPSSPDDWLLDKKSVKRYLAGLTDERRLRLLAAAYWAAQIHRIEQDDGPTGLREAVLAAERWADGQEWHEVRSPAGEPFAVLAKNIAAMTACTVDVIYHHPPRKASAALAHALFEDIFGKGGRRKKVDLTSRIGKNDTVARLAHTIYDERAFDRLPLLADVLEEAGRRDKAVLDHCRQPGPHVRGCWVIDVILGKE
jgi:hypothetical protein